MLDNVIIQPVPFYNDVVRSAKGLDGRMYAVISDMCRRLGLAPSMQVKRIQEDETYQGFTMWVSLHTAKRGSAYKALALDLDMVPLWLSNIEASRVRSDVKPKLLLYKRDCARVLRAYWSRRVILDTYLMPGYRPWEREYSWEFAERVMELYGKPMPQRDRAYPPAVRGFINRYIRKILPVEVRQELRLRNPPSPRGNLPRRDWQHFTPEALNDVERKRRDLVFGFLQASPTMSEFKRLLRRHDDRMRPIVEAVTVLGTEPSLLPTPVPQLPLALT